MAAVVANGNGHAANGNGVANGAELSPKGTPKPAAPARPPTGQGVVLEVKSGDTMEVQCGGTKRKITMAGCNAPRLGFQNNPDEPYAWEAREYLREKLVGKQVAFKVSRQVGDRDYAEVRYDTKNVALDVLKAGFAKYQPSKDNKDAECQEASDEAAAAGKGCHGPADACIQRKLVQLDQSNLGDFLSRNKGKVRECIIEYIRNAGTYRVVMPPMAGLSASDDEFLYCEISLSGVNCPGFRWQAGEEVELTPGNGAKEARSWIAPRILNKKLSFRVEGKNADERAVTLIGTLQHPVKGPIAEFLLEEGHGAYVAWSAEGSVSGPEKLRSCEEKAQRMKKGRWREGGAAASAAKIEKPFTGKIVEVISGDQLRIVNAEDKVERRYYVASLRARAAGVKANDAKEKPWSDHIVEKMRKQFVGKGTFSVQIEFAKNQSLFTQAASKKAADAAGSVTETIATIAAGGNPAPGPGGPVGPPPSDEKTGDLYYVTIYNEKGENMFTKVIEEGLLTVDRGDQTYRSKHFQEYCDAEDAAKEKGKGRHGGKEPPSDNLTELIMGSGKDNKGIKSRKELVDRAKGYENQLKGKEFSGTVMYCVSGTRFRVKLTHEKLLLNFQISGVKSPASGPSGPVSAEVAANIPERQPLGPESLQFARENVMQQDVKVYIERIDPAGCFQGQIFALTKDGKSKKGDLATELIKRGLAWTDNYCTIQQYINAEAECKKSKIGLHADEHAAFMSGGAGQDESNAKNPALAEGKTFKGKVTYINAIDDFYVVMDQGAANSIASQCSQAASKAEPVEAMAQAKGTGKGKGGGLDRQAVYLGQDWNDKKWYRCKYSGSGSEGHTMKFIDSGAIGEVDKKAVRKCPMDLAKQPPAAVHCSLYGVKAPNMEGMWEAAGQQLYTLTDKNEVVGVIEPRPTGLTRKEAEKEDPNVHKVTLMVGSKCIQEELLQKGVVRMKLKENKPKVVDINVYKQAQDTAKRARINIWKMGDPGDSDDEEQRW